MQLKIVSGVRGKIDVIREHFGRLRKSEEYVFVSERKCVCVCVKEKKRVCMSIKE